MKNLHKTLSACSCEIQTPLGNMLAIADEEALLLLEFLDTPALSLKVKKLGFQQPTKIQPGNNDSILSIKQELKAYFEGKLKVFKTPLRLQGTPFQEAVWQALIQIPYGETRSYLDQSVILNKPTAFRAVANANGRNRMAIIIPCHRVIQHDGKLGGYAGGLKRKQWLLNHETVP